MNLKKYILFVAVSILLLAPGLTSCLNDNDNTTDYKDWINLNETYLTRMEDSVHNGEKVFEKIIPVWAPSVYILAQWHNDRSLTEGNLSPMDNSTCQVVYDAYYVNGTRLDASFLHYSDSIYTCKPSDNIVGFWTMLTKMNVGDSVTCVIPMNAAYGASTSSSVIPYSTLIYHMKLKGIKAYEVSGK